jgi:hypothetical protein
VGNWFKVDARIVASFCLCASILANEASAEVGHVIHISVDGLRGDLLKSQLDANPALYPNFMRFVNEGATTFNARTDVANT